jgi:hypothetical protein
LEKEMDTFSKNSVPPNPSIEDSTNPLLSCASKRLLLPNKSTLILSDAEGHVFALL